VKIAVVLFNLGGPDSLDAIEPFLRNLFGDPAIISLPGFVRYPLARLIAARRGPVAREIYAHMGGRSPILQETEEQARALEAVLQARGHDAKCVIAMRYWHPLTAQAVAAVKAFSPDRVVLLPLYPQYSTTTTGSSLSEWRKLAARARLAAPHHEVCCYPFEDGFVSALCDLLANAFNTAKPDLSYRVLFSAHGLPKRVIERGDPYQWQVERTVQAVLERWPGASFDHTICYQSRVGPLEWIGPSTDNEIRRAGAERKALIVVPVAFVSEHSETLVELDIEYGKLAREAGVPDYIRVSAVRSHPMFIEGLARLVDDALSSPGPVNCAGSRICPGGRICRYERISPHA
jgi:protoporphyrin/coproporphyrin ferrochelatase